MTRPVRQLAISASAEPNTPKLIHPRHAVPAIAHPKKKGEYADSEFQHECLRRSLTPCKPWGDCAPFDFVVWISGQRLVRVQVKSNWATGLSHYAFRTTGNTIEHPTYHASDVDLLACYIVELRLWYFIPISEIEPDQSYLYLFPNGGDFRSDRLGRRRSPRRTRSYEAFKDRWDLLR
jgi:hypothetical protein